jgi:hypothetical protein
MGTGIETKANRDTGWRFAGRLEEAFTPISESEGTSAACQAVWRWFSSLAKRSPFTALPLVTYTNFGQSTSAEQFAERGIPSRDSTTNTP